MQPNTTRETSKEVMDAAVDYSEKGWVAIPAIYGSKGIHYPRDYWLKEADPATGREQKVVNPKYADDPRGLDATSASLEATMQRLNDHPGCGIGVVLGPVSHNLVDIDLDSIHAVDAAPFFFPRCGHIFGSARPATSPTTYNQVEDLDGPYGLDFDDPFGRQIPEGEKAKIVEIRGKHQTIFPPSVYENREPRQWHRKEAEVTTTHLASLERAARLTTAAVLLFRNWRNSKPGLRNDGYMTLCGWLIRWGMEKEEVEAFVSVMHCLMADDDPLDLRLRIVTHTLGLKETDAPYTSDIKACLVTSDEQEQKDIEKHLASLLGFKGRKQREESKRPKKQDALKDEVIVTGLPLDEWLPASRDFLDKRGLLVEETEPHAFVIKHPLAEGQVGTLIYPTRDDPGFVRFEYDPAIVIPSIDIVVEQLRQEELIDARGVAICSYLMRDCNPPLLKPLSGRAFQEIISGAAWDYLREPPVYRAALALSLLGDSTLTSEQWMFAAIIKEASTETYVEHGEEQTRQHHPDAKKIKGDADDLNKLLMLRTNAGDTREVRICNEVLDQEFAYGEWAMLVYGELWVYHPSLGYWQTGPDVDSEVRGYLTRKLNALILQNSQLKTAVNSCFDTFKTIAAVRRREKGLPVIHPVSKSYFQQVIPVRNGVISLFNDDDELRKTPKLVPHSPNNFFHYALDIVWTDESNPKIRRKWQSFMLKTLNRDSELAWHFEEIVATTLMEGPFHEPTVVRMEGEGSNGKSAWQALLASLMRVHTLQTQKSRKVMISKACSATGKLHDNQFTMGQYIGMKIVSFTEIGEHFDFSSSQIKTGGDASPISCELKHVQKPIEILPQWVTFCWGNPSEGRMSDTGYSMERRLHSLHLTHRFGPPTKVAEWKQQGTYNPRKDFLQDDRVVEKLMGHENIRQLPPDKQAIHDARRSGVLYELVMALMRLHRRGGFLKPQHCVDRYSALVKQNNPMTFFLEHHCSYQPGVRTLPKDIVSVYARVMRENYNREPDSRIENNNGGQQFWQALKIYGIKQVRSNGQKYVDGLRINPPEDRIWLTREDGTTMRLSTTEDNTIHDQSDLEYAPLHVGSNRGNPIGGAREIEFNSEKQPSYAMVPGIGSMDPDRREVYRLRPGHVSHRVYNDE